MALKKISPCYFESGNATVITSEKFLESIEEEAVRQIENVGELPGIIGKAIAMPDIHQGYGFPIGGVAAFDKNEGAVTPGGIGFDINCGVRVMKTNLSLYKLQGKINKVLTELLNTIPVGLKSRKNPLKKEELKEVLVKGAGWAVENGYGYEEDLTYCEDGGCLENADPSKVSEYALKRGMPQLGTLGSGNHFVELQKVDEIFDEETAAKYGLEKDQVLVMIHTGSRGLGHQIASDYINVFKEKYSSLMEQLPDKNLVHAPLISKEGKDYMAAMKCAANFAWANRQVIMHQVREALGCKGELLYDVSHNIARFEKHEVEGEEKEVCVIRKGATRAYEKERPEIKSIFDGTGQPVILPGSMGTSSYIIEGSKNKGLFSSCAHGAGRKLSRSQARSSLETKKIKDYMKEKNIICKGTDDKGLREESHLAYKEVSDVVEVIENAGIGKKVVRLIPIGVIKG